MKPKKIFLLYRLLDYLMSPLMRLISLAPFERPQETHIWHCQKIADESIETIDMDLAVTLKGTERSKFTNGVGPLFHMPILGGWKKYTVLSVQPNVSPWYVGWIVKNNANGAILTSAVHRLPISDRHVRLMIGTPHRTTVFFAVNADGHQLQLEEVGRGSIGDGSEYKNIRLF